MSNKVRILFFATIKERVGLQEIFLEIPDNCSINDLRIAIGVRYPGIIQDIQTALIAVNKEYADSMDLIPLGAEIAVFPPVSGGAEDNRFVTIYKIQEEMVDLDAITSAITQPSTGAICSFTGVVRARTERGDAHETEYLDYEAYVPMAEVKMEQIALEMRERWPSIEGIAIIQRIGRLTPMVPTVVIACSAAHRDTGVFEAAHYGIDRLKEIVPIWKRETGPNGQVWIEGDYIPKPGE